MLINELNGRNAKIDRAGRGPIRLDWFGLVLPALVLNYFGQGALVLAQPEAIDSPFYHLFPNWLLYPMTLLATAATVIASQAVISGAFSLSQQAMQLSLLPRLDVRQTSEETIGQVYVPQINWLLMTGWKPHGIFAWLPKRLGRGLAGAWPRYHAAHG